MGYVNILSVCDSVMFLKVLYFLKQLLNVICFVVPMGLIVIVSLDFAKSVIASRDDDMRKNMNTSIKRIIYAVGLFLVPVFVSVGIGFVGDDALGYQDCFNITKVTISRKIQQQKAQCVGDSYWSNTTFQCKEKEHYDEAEESIYKTKVRNFSDSAYSSSNTNMTTSGGVKKMKYYNQGDYAHVKYCGGGKTMKSSGCGATSLAIMTTAFSNKKYDPAYVGKWLCDNGHTGGGTPWKFFTMKKMLNHFGLQVDVLFKKDGKVKGNAGKKYDKSEGEKILNAVKQGKGIILHIPGHYVAVGPHTSCKNNEVYLYEVGKRANVGCYTTKELFDLTYNNKNRCSNYGNCGWKAAFAYIGQ